MPVKLMCTGDFMTGENVHHYRRGIITKFKGRYADLIDENARKVINLSDLMLLNFEASIVPDHEIQNLSIDRGVYVAPMESLGLLKGLDTRIIVNVANNHFGQHGKEAAEYTIGTLKQNGIGVTGCDNKPLVLDIAGVKISIWGCSLVKDKHDNGSYFKSSYSALPDDLDLPEKQPGEIRIISIHWGEEYITRQNNAQELLAGKLSDAGFDYIIGHHPHVIQPVSTIGNTRVFYSHGNFIFDQNFSGLTQKGLVSMISLEERQVELYFSQQKKFRLISLTPTDQSGVEKFCRENHHPRKPLIMRIRMKLELLYRFHELNRAIINTFTSRMFRN
jgi:poly-gamma-glutamate synthesis protein (capsule biosynthesis protein)